MMCAKNQETDTKAKPFTITCNNCGGHNVTVTAYEYYDLGVICHGCKTFLNCGSYNEAKYTEEERWESSNLWRKT